MVPPIFLLLPTLPPAHAAAGPRPPSYCDATSRTTETLVDDGQGPALTPVQTILQAIHPEGGLDNIDLLHPGLSVERALMDNGALLEAMETTVARWQQYADNAARQAASVEALMHEIVRLRATGEADVVVREQFDAIAQRLGTGIPWWSSFTNAIDVTSRGFEKWRLEWLADYLRGESALTERISRKTEETIFEPFREFVIEEEDPMYRIVVPLDIRRLWVEQLRTMNGMMRAIQTNIDEYVTHLKAESNERDFKNMVDTLIQHQRNAAESMAEGYFEVDVEDDDLYRTRAGGY